MQEPGRKLRRAREHLRLKYRDVEELSSQIARQRDNPEFAIGLSRLADIENKGTVPSVYRLYSLCAIYGLDFAAVLNWYGVALDNLVVESARISVQRTRPVDVKVSDATLVDVPVELRHEVDLRRNAYISRQARKWGKVPLAILSGLDIKRQRYAFIGTDDWSMHPILPPGSFIQIDESRRRVGNESWTGEHQRPIYFLEHRDGYRCGWCTSRNGFLIVQPHPSSRIGPDMYTYPGEADVIGQVVGVAMRLDLGRRRHTRS